MADILVVEDDPYILDIIAGEVENMGHCVTVARNGEEAIRSLLTQPPQVILSDICMPKMNGFQLRWTLTNRFPHLSHVPVIFVSAYSDQFDVADGLARGASHYVTKPIDFAVLEEVIEESVQH